jgi:hypothetical protein
MANNKVTSTKPSLDSIKAVTNPSSLAHIYVGIVKDVDTYSRNGTLFVYIDGLGNHAPNNRQDWFPVRYASPFLGHTTGTDILSGKNTYTNTRQSYGMFMTPPDIGNKVLCCFPNGKNSEGFWFACVSDYLGKSMVPANSAEPLANIDADSIPDNLKARVKPNGYYPTGEYNDSKNTAFSPSWFKNKKPINPFLSEQYINQGLDRDPRRGPLNSTPNRDIVNGVFGISTPGRPSPDPANDQQLRTKIEQGDFTIEDFNVKNRQGGHSFVMDDGDLFGKSKLSRWRSAAGHQIMMFDEEDQEFIYISNARGDSWVELSPGGEVLVYSAMGINMRSHGPIQIHSDNSLNINADYIRMYGKNGVHIESTASVKIRGDNSINLYGKEYITTNTASLIMNSSKGVISASGALNILGSPVNVNSGGNATAPLVDKLPQNTHSETEYVNNTWEAKPSKVKSISTHLPTHEPYTRKTLQELEGINKTQAQSAAAAGNSTQSSPNPQEAYQNQQEAKKASSNSVTGIASGANNTNGAAGQGGSGGGANTTTGKPDPAKYANPKKQAPEAFLRKQPEPKGGIGNLEQSEVKALFGQTGYTESTGKYDAVNTLGYVGKYQMGAAALANQGLVKRGTTQAQLKDPSVWVGGPGKPTSRDEFLSNKQLQEDTMYKYTQSNYNTLKKNGVITDGTPKEEVAGLLSASHLGGTGGASKFYSGKTNAADAYGTSVGNYYSNGVYAIQAGAPKLASASDSKNKLGA